MTSIVRNDHGVSLPSSVADIAARANRNGVKATVQIIAQPRGWQPDRTIRSGADLLQGLDG